MNSKYKLTYFHCTGRAEPIRFLLAYGNIDYEDHRIQWEEWNSTSKENYPLGQLPVLEIDGKMFNHSISICRHLGSVLKLTGSDQWDALQADIAVDTLTDIASAVFLNYWNADPESKATKFKKLQEEEFPFYMSRMNKIVKENGGYFVKNQLTWADFVFSASIQDMLNIMKMKDLSEYPELCALDKKIKNLPQVKEWISVRPESEPMFTYMN